MPEPSRWTLRTLAAQALGTLEPLTRAVVPPLHVATTFIRDPDNEYRSGYAYGRPDNATVHPLTYGSAVLTALGAALQDQSAMVRRRTLDTLGEIGPPARALLPAVQEALHDSEPEVRQAASDASAKIR